MPTEELLDNIVGVDRPSASARSDDIQVSDERTIVSWLIDNADAYRALLVACGKAQTSIWISQLAFDADCVALCSADEAPAIEGACDVRLADAILEAASARGVDVRILLNASLLLDTAASLREYVRAAGADPLRVRIRGVSRFPQLLHAKVVVVDGVTALLIGSPFVNGY